MECCSNLAWCLALLACTCCCCPASGTGLIKRIRERQNADDATTRTDDAWVQVPQSVLLSIDDKLRGLDTLKLARLDSSLDQLARLDFYLGQLSRRMDSVESKLTRLDTKFDLRMERAEGAFAKGELMSEQLVRRLDAHHEKVTRGVAALESRASVKLDSLERDLHSSVDEILERLVKGEEKTIALENEMVKGEEKMDEVSTQVRGLASFARRDMVGNLTRKIEQGVEEVRTAVDRSEKAVLAALHDQADNLTCRQEQLRARSRGADEQVVTQEQMDNLTAVLGRALTSHEAKFAELDSDVEMYTRKVVNGIQELWRTSDDLKTDLSSTLEQGSKTREMVRQEFRRLHEQIEPLPKLEPKLTGLSEDLDRKVFELSATVDSSFATLLVAQNTFIDSCRRIQQEETHVYDILQQIVYEMRNRSVSDMRMISGELRSQGTEINRSLSRVLAAVLNMTSVAVDDLSRSPAQCVVVKAGDWESLCRSRNDTAKVEIDAVMYDAESEDLVDRTSDAGLNLQDYDIDYQLSESY